MDREDRSKLYKVAHEHWAAGCIDKAIAVAWTGYHHEPQDVRWKMLIAALLGVQASVSADKRPDLLRLVQDRDVNPDHVSLAGWHLVLDDPVWKATTKNGDFATLAAHLDDDELAQALLRESPVHVRAAERELAKVRRWLLTSGEWERYRRLVDAFTAQTALNGGAWPFDDTENGLLDEAFGLPIFGAYLPEQESVLTPRSDVSEPMMRAVAEDYERWPYPVWNRTGAQLPTTLPAFIRTLDPDGPHCIPVNASILIAGCGTGQQAVHFALKYPDAKITAIDLSGASLSYARQRCAALGIRDIRFVHLDLHNVSELNENFDCISSTGVLHHLPDPERGWDALAAVLRPGGVMHVMVYSRIGRAEIEAERTLIRSFITPGPITDDTLRQVRQVLRDQPNSNLRRTRDFSTLAGTYDSTLHRRADFFDVPRISRVLDRAGLRLLGFIMREADVRRRYDVMFPHDPMHRDFEAIAKFEETEPGTWRGMYELWCRSAILGNA